MTTKTTNYIESPARKRPHAVQVHAAREQTAASLPALRHLQLLSRQEIMALTGLSYPTIWAWTQEGRFPRARKVGGKNMWLATEIDAWVAALELRELKPRRCVMTQVPADRWVNLADIHFGDRLRLGHSDKLPALAESMTTLGQLQAIVVRPRQEGGYWLVSGRHRYMAANRLGWKQIHATVSDMTDDQATLAENRREPDPR